jgi:hypothetical protein
MIERFLKIRENSRSFVILYLMKIIPFKRVNLHLPKVAFSSYDLVLGRIILTKYPTNYSVYNDDFLFNSYYNNVGKRVLRPSRGLMTRPSVAEVYNYRKYVTAMVAF